MFRFHFSPLRCEYQASVISHLCSSHPPSNVYRTLPQNLCVIVKVNILRYQGEFFSPNAERKSEKKTFSAILQRWGKTLWANKSSTLPTSWSVTGSWVKGELGGCWTLRWLRRQAEDKMGLVSRVDLEWFSWKKIESYVRLKAWNPQDCAILILKI